MALGFVYLTAVVDVASRRVLAHKVATSLEACHATQVISKALAKYGKPDIVNTDQGSQGGFNRSSQHLQSGGVYGATRRMDETIDREGCDALARGSFTSSRGRAAVLVTDCNWNHQ